MEFSEYNRLTSQRQFAPKCSFLVSRPLGHCSFVSQTSFAGETVGGVSKCLFSQANGKLEYRHLHKISNKL